MTRYVTIAADGTLRQCAGVLDLDAEVGPEGPARVQLHPAIGCAGWVNDIGLTDPERYPRNVVGSCLLGCLGAAMQPYAGTVVITGWDIGADFEAEIVTLPLAADLADLMHADVLHALAGEPVSDGLPPDWADGVRAFAEHVRTAPNPGIQLINLGPGGAR